MLKLVILPKFPGARTCPGGQNKEATLPGGFGRGFPNALAMLRLPAVCLAHLGEVLGDALAAFLSLGVLDFVEVHSFYFLSFFVS